MSLVAHLKKTLAALAMGLGLVACNTVHSQSPTRFEVHEASLTASPDWQEVKLRDGSQTLYVSTTVLLDNSDVALAGAKKDLSGQVFMEIQLTPAGTVRMTQASRVLQRQRMAVMIDGEVLTAPVVQGPISGNRFAITGFKSLEEAQQVAGGITGEKINSDPPAASSACSHVKVAAT